MVKKLNLVALGALAAWQWQAQAGRRLRRKSEYASEYGSANQERTIRRPTWTLQCCTLARIQMTGSRWTRIPYSG